MSELLNKYADISNGLVDIFEAVSKDETDNEIGLLLLKSSMNINRLIRQLEDEQNPLRYSKKQIDAVKEINSVEFFITMLINSGSIAEGKSVSVLQDCMRFRELLMSGQIDGG